MSTKLHLKHTTSIVLNPVVHSFLEFLPLNKIEFVDKIKNEVESNPMLDVEYTGTPPQKDEKEINVIENKLERADSSFMSRYEEEGFFRPDENKIDKNRAIELFTPSEVNLMDHLMSQAMTKFDDREMEIAENIIYNLNNDGYLDVVIESIAPSLDTTAEEIERIRSIITTFDPPGVASKSLKECLMAQVDDVPENDTLKQLISDHLEDLSKSKYAEIMKKLKIDKEELARLLSKLKRLNPRPGANFDKEEIDYAEVDLLLIKEGNEYKVRYIEDGMPRLQLSSYYDEMLQHKLDRHTKSYLKERYRNANLFIEGIELRKSMILKIAEFLVKTQKDYLDFGEKWKKPLTMREVAGELSYNESTISRAVNNKYMASDKGLISLKSFFTYGLKGEFGFKHSVETIRDKIKRIIEEEPKDSPLSDQEIADKLNQLGIRISRRTIRNYRDEMNLPNSSKRKEEYKIQGA
jgi:RNA polymerase sigma-54 factor